MSEFKCGTCQHSTLGGISNSMWCEDCGPSYNLWQPLNAMPMPSAPTASATTPVETDPLGRDQHQPGAKLDAGKVRLGLVLGDFSRALVEVGKVGTYGAQKYTDGGWLTVPNGPARYRDAHLRHMLATVPNDSDTGLSHLAHAAWNALAELELHLRAQQ